MYQVKAEEESARVELERIRAENQAARERHARLADEIRRLNALESSADPQCASICCLRRLLSLIDDSPSPLPLPLHCTSLIANQSHRNVMPSVHDFTSVH